MTETKFVETEQSLDVQMTLRLLMNNKNTEGPLDLETIIERINLIYQTDFQPHHADQRFLDGHTSTHLENNQCSVFIREPDYRVLEITTN